jgi:hypothetical protein
MNTSDKLNNPAERVAARFTLGLLFTPLLGAFIYMLVHTTSPIEILGDVLAALIMTGVGYLFWPTVTARPAPTSTNNT